MSRINISFNGKKKNKVWKNWIHLFLVASQKINYWINDGIGINGGKNEKESYLYHFQIP
jgi:hypothetical protein